MRERRGFLGCFFFAGVGVGVGVGVGAGLAGAVEFAGGIGFAGGVEPWVGGGILVAGFSVVGVELRVGFL